MEKRRKLLKGTQKFQAKKAHIGGSVLAKDFGDDGGSLAGDLAGGRGGGRGDGEVDNLIGAEDVS
jgi:hypothetical protein